MADGRRVAGEFGVAATGDSFSVPSAGEATGSLPVANIRGAFEAEFLIEKEGLNFARKLERRNGDIPAGGVGGSAGGFPLVDGSDGKVGRLKRDGGATGRDPGSGGGGIGSIARVAHPIEHQLLPGIELEAEPVPTFLIFAESRGGEFVIEPREALDWNFFTPEFELT